MPKPGISAAFARYGAKLKNVNWSVSAVAADGALVVSLWAQHLSTENGALVCRDSFGRWRGPGNSEFRQRVTAAFVSQQPVRLVIARASDPGAVQRGEDASQQKKEFGVREDLIGSVTAIDGDDYTITFVRKQPPPTARQ